MSVSVAATRFGTFPRVNDHHDMRIYFERGRWMVTGQQPYRDVFSEYPQIATWLFAIPHVGTAIWSRLSGTQQHPERLYRYLFSGLMALFLAGTIAMLYTLRHEHQWLAFLLLLPAGCYFTQNRFDIVPAFLTVASLHALRGRRCRTACALLAIATATKWYGLVMMPVFVIYLYRTNQRVPWSEIMSYGLVLGVIVLPTLLAIGWQGFLNPYKFHLTRLTNPESMLHLIMALIARLHVSHPLIDQVLLHGFLALQFAVAPLCLLVRLDTWDRVVTWSALSILCFMLFAKFYSPQWILWVTPLLVLLANRPIEVAGIVLLYVVTYVYFPYLYHLPDKPPMWFPGIIALKTALLALWMLHLLYRERAYWCLISRLGMPQQV